MAVKLTSPHPFKERFLFFGGGGSGKTNTVLKIAEYLADAEFHVVESDISWAYERALATDFTDIADRVHVTTPESDWVSYTEAFAEVAQAGNPDKDCLVVDSITPTWPMVQDWFLTELYGMDFAAFSLKLKQEYKNDREYAKALSEAMQWPTIKKEYQARIYRYLERWRGHMIVTAQAKAVSGQDKDDVQMEFGPLGFKPSGEAQLMYLASTNMYLAHPRRGQWIATATKDRNREELDKAVIEDFGMDYLVDVAGWNMEKVRAA